MNRQIQDEKTEYRIGVMIGNVYTNHPQEVLRGIYAAAKEYPVMVELFPGTQSRNFYQEAIGGDISGSNDFEYQFNTIYDFALFGDLDALIISYGTLCIFLEEREKNMFFQKYGHIPHVVLEEPVEDGNSNYIVSDNYSGIEQLMEHLITGHGYRRILHISGPLDNTDAMERRKAYLDMMKKYHLPVTEDMILYGDYTEYMSDAIEEFLRKHPDAEAVCAANDGMAIGTYKACKKLGKQVGRELAVVGYDDIFMASSLNPPLTTVEQNGYDMGYLALQKAFALCRGRKETNDKLRARMIKRQSCGCMQNDRRNYLSGIDDKGILRMIPELAAQMAGKVLLSTQNWRVIEFTKNYLTQLISYIVRQVYLSEKETEIARHCRHVQRMMNLVAEGNWFDEVSIPAMVEQVSELLMNLHEIETRVEKKRYYMELMKCMNAYVLNTYRRHQSDKEIDYSRKAWLGPLLVREMVKPGCQEKEVYLEAIEGMRRQNMASSYIFLFDKPVIYHQGDEWECPDKLWLAAYHRGRKIRVYEENERPVVTRQQGFSAFLAGAGHEYVAFSLFFEQIQYGMLLCEIGNEDISSTYVASLQLATGIHFLELNKKEYETQRELEKMMAELQAKNQILQSISNSDDLTGLLNRRGFIEELLERMKRHAGEQAYILFVDLDHLKQINDNFGHVEGDFSIRQIGEVLKQQTGSNAVVARIGGDEFVAAVFLQKGQDQEDIRRAIREECKKRNQSSKKEYLIECSIGILEFTCDDTLAVSELLKEADSIMYQEKQNRRASVLKKENKK